MHGQNVGNETEDIFSNAHMSVTLSEKMVKEEPSKMQIQVLENKKTQEFLLESQIRV